MVLVALTAQAQGLSSKQISVVTFGANPAEAGDDTAAIQKAFAEIKSGQTLFFPKGVYSLSDATILSTPQVNLQGEGKASIIRFDNSQDLYKKYGISDEEIAFIETLVRPMSTGDE